MRAAARALVLGLLPGLAAAAAPLETVETVDLGRYAGRWHQIAHIPNVFQQMCARDTVATYRVLAPGALAVVNRCRDADGEEHSASGVARLNSRYGDPARLEVRFAPAWLAWLPWVWGDYWIIALEADYSAVLVGAPDREYLWVLARGPALAAGVYARLVERAAAQGFDVARLVREPGTTLEPEPPAGQRQPVAGPASP